MVAHRRANGEGTIYRRKDGRYEAAAYFQTTSGQRKRIRVYGKSHAEVHRKIIDAQILARSGMPVPSHTTRIDAYLDYWLENIVHPGRRLTTYLQYETVCRLYLKPGVGAYSLHRLTVAQLQDFLNSQRTAGQSLRKVHLMRTVLSAALTNAQREESITRNVARLVVLQPCEPREVRPWSADEAVRFIDVSREHPLHLAFLLITFYGLRRGEVLGLRWQDIDTQEREIHIRQQLQRADHQLRLGPLKTKASKRDLPMLDLVWDALTAHRARQQAARKAAGSAWKGDEHDLVFTTKSGLPIEPRNFARSFQHLCEEHGLRRITVHHVRHSATTLLRRLGISARVVQRILGHSRVSTTQEIYEHDDMQDRRRALQRVERLFMRVPGGRRCRQLTAVTDSIDARFTTFLSGGAMGTRTPDLLHAMHAISTKINIANRARSVKGVMQARTRLWLIGLVAVSVAVKKSTVPPDSEEAPCSVE
jgi:integrase